MLRQITHDHSARRLHVAAFTWRLTSHTPFRRAVVRRTIVSFIASASGRPTARVLCVRRTTAPAITTTLTAAAVRIAVIAAVIKIVNNLRLRHNPTFSFCLFHSFSRNLFIRKQLTYRPQRPHSGVTEAFFGVLLPDFVLHLHKCVACFQLERRTIHLTT
jgi:hypothetical protein